VGPRLVVGLDRRLQRLDRRASAEAQLRHQRLKGAPDLGGQPQLRIPTQHQQHHPRRQGLQDVRGQPAGLAGIEEAQELGEDHVGLGGVGLPGHGRGESQRPCQTRKNGGSGDRAGAEERTGQRLSSWVDNWASANPKTALSGQKFAGGILRWLDVGMRRFFLTVAALSVACGGAEANKDPLSPCSGLEVEIIDTAIAPPAHVAALVRVTTCEGEALGAPLAAADFELLEDERPISAYEAPRAILPAARQTAERTAVLLDLSGSIVRSGIKPAMLEGARSLSAALAGDRHQVALYGFDGRPDLVPLQAFTAEPDELESALALTAQTSIVDDSTNLHGAVVNALRVMDQEVRLDERDGETEAHGSVVVFTDGVDQAGRVDRRTMRDVIEDSRHSVFAIGVGPEVDEERLNELGTAGAVKAEPDEIVAAFERVSAQIAGRAQSYYIVSYCSPARAGQRSVTIEVTSKDQRGEVTLPYSAEGFGAGCAPENAPLR
jgi:uncharacterized protein YegL